MHTVVYISCDNRDFYVEMSLYRELSWVSCVPQEYRGNGKYYCSSVGMGEITEMVW